VRHANGTPLRAPDGPFFSKSKIKLIDIMDGTSNTATFSEHLKGDFNNGVASDILDTFAPGSYPSTRDEAYAYVPIHRRTHRAAFNRITETTGLQLQR
jgi:hypothetical protein